MRHLVINALLLCLAACGSDRAVSCKSNDKGSLDCREVPTRPRSEEKVVVTIDAAGRCLIGSFEVSCPKVGSELRRQFPSVNPVIVVCPDRTASYEHVGAATNSIHDEAFLNELRFSSAMTDCAIDGLPPNTSLERTRER